MTLTGTFQLEPTLEAELVQQPIDIHYYAIKQTAHTEQAASTLSATYDGLEFLVNVAEDIPLENKNHGQDLQLFDIFLIEILDDKAILTFGDKAEMDGLVEDSRPELLDTKTAFTHPDDNQADSGI